ncbi:MAG: Kelch repeat-containing protein [Thermoleophilaceae bacterium]
MSNISSGRLGYAAWAAALLVLLAAPSASLAIGSWSASPSLGAARQLHAATLISGTRVLLAGGLSPGGPTANSEIFDSQTRRWSQAAPLATPRLAPVGVTLRGGRVLVAGGGAFSLTSRPSYLTSAEIYDPPSNRWLPAGNMPTARANAAATLLADGRVLVAGGLNSFGPGLKSAEIYNPVTNSWSSAGPMAEGRFHHTATLLPNGKVLVAGGHQLTGDGSTVALSSAELYDPVSNSWSKAPRMSVPRDNHTATPLLGGRVLIVGGGTRTAGFVRSAEVYDPAGNRWAGAGRLGDPRGFHAATLLPGGDVLAVGGLDDCGALSSAERFSPATGRWARAPSLRTPRSRATATAFADGQAVVVGGSTYVGATLRSSELLRPGGSDRTGPQMCGPSLSPLRLRPPPSGPSVGRRGLAVRYRLSESGVVAFTVRRLMPGRLQGRRCAAARAPIPRRLRCVRPVGLRGGFSRRSRSGRNLFHFRGRIGGRTLSPGSYQLVASPRDRRRNRGVPANSGFRIVR